MVLEPIIENGRTDWVVEYNKRYPDSIKKMPIHFRERLMIKSLHLQDTWATYELVKAGVCITRDVLDIACDEMVDAALEIHGGDVNIARERRGMADALYPVVRHLRKKYPKRVAGIAVVRLLPHIPEIYNEDRP